MPINKILLKNIVQDKIDELKQSTIDSAARKRTAQLRDPKFKGEEVPIYKAGTKEQIGTRRKPGKGVIQLRLQGREESPGKPAKKPLYKYITPGATGRAARQDASHQPVYDRMAEVLFERKLLEGIDPITLGALGGAGFLAGRGAYRMYKGYKHGSKGDKTSGRKDYGSKIPMTYKIGSTIGKAVKGFQAVKRRINVTSKNNSRKEARAEQSKKDAAKAAELEAANAEKAKKDAENAAELEAAKKVSYFQENFSSDSDYIRYRLSEVILSRKLNVPVEQLSEVAFLAPLLRIGAGLAQGAARVGSGVARGVSKVGSSAAKSLKTGAQQLGKNLKRRVSIKGRRALRNAKREIPGQISKGVDSSYQVGKKIGKEVTVDKPEDTYTMSDKGYDSGYQSTTNYDDEDTNYGYK